MRVITGRFKGRRLSTVRGLSVRPATDRVKKTIFDLLMTRLDLDGATVLDLFAGTGSLGIEALSRGARTVIFVESDRRAASVIRSNLEALGCTADADVLETDAVAFLRRTAPPCDLIFADPPYAFEGTDELPRLVFDRGVLAPGGILVMEHAGDVDFPAVPGCARGPVRTFGRTVVSLFRHAHESGKEEPS